MTPFFNRLITVLDAFSNEIGVNYMISKPKWRVKNSEFNSADNYKNSFHLSINQVIRAAIAHIRINATTIPI